MTYLKPSAPKIVAASPALMLPPSPPHCGPQQGFTLTQPAFQLPQARLQPVEY